MQEYEHVTQVQVHIEAHEGNQITLTPNQTLMGKWGMSHSPFAILTSFLNFLMVVKGPCFKKVALSKLSVGHKAVLLAKTHGCTTFLKVSPYSSEY